MGEKYLVLLVEDIKIAQKVAMITLTALGCEVDTADTGAQALEFINKKRYDVIFLDLGLPDTDGLTLAEAIRKMEKQGQRVPIIALTAHSENDIKANCFKVGMDDFIEKPINADNGQHILEKYVHK